MVYKISVQLSQIGKIHTRRVVGIFDLLAELGGIFYIILASLSILVKPFTEFSFIYSAASKLFYGRTFNKHIFKGGLDERT